MDSQNIDAVEIVTNPSRSSEEIITIIARLAKKHEASIRAGNAFRRLGAAFRLQMYIRDGFRDFYTFLRGYSDPAGVSSLSGMAKIRALCAEFERIYDRIILNNFAIAFALVHGGKIESTVETAEDRKVLLLKGIVSGNVSISDFKKEFGHYGLNVYELSERRFEEYDDPDIRKIALLAANVPIKNKPTLDESIVMKKIESLSVLVALREFARYQVLFVVRDIRYELLRMSTKLGDNNIFSRSFQEIAEMEERLTAAK